MNERIKKLRELSLKTKPSLDPERALLMTEFYESCRSATLSVPMKRALAFKHACERKTIYIGAGELIVGERGTAPKATPTFPEINVHSLEDLDILNGREKIPYTVSPETRRLYKERIIPFWKGQTVREKILAEMTPDWKDAYEAGVFTEFMEQRAPGHTVLDDKIYTRGLLDFKAAIAASLAALDFERDPDALRKTEELRAMDVSADALIRLAERHSEKARALALKEKDARRKRELLRIAEVCARVPARAPRDFWEALQSYWFIHLGVISELNTWDSFNPGKLDQHLAPFYRDGLAGGRLTQDQARELLQAFWIKFNNQPAPPKVGVTAEESATYTDFCQINFGGLTPEGGDAVSDLTYLLLDVVEEMRLLQPSSSVQVSRRNPDLFVQRAIRIIKTGFGQPSFFNADLIVEELLRQGKTLEDARRGGSSGCVEVGVFGRENYNLTGYFNLPKILEITLSDGVDPRTGKSIGLRTGDPASFAGFDRLFEAYARQVRHFVDIKIRGNAVIERIYAEVLPAPYLSILIDDCIARGRDYHDGGARYNTSYIQGVGLGTISDALTAIKHNVYDKKAVAFKDLLQALRRDFKGREALRRRLIDKTPKFGNDDDAADMVMKRVFDLYYDTVNGRPNAKGGVYRINLLPTTVHVYFGKVTGATADGRKAGEPFSEGVSPVQGADRRGPTAVLKSVAKMDHVRTGGTLLNQKFTPQLLSDEKGAAGLLHLIRSYFKLDGHHIQFNVVSADVLRDAQRHPDKHRDLIVRVAGYSDYFVDLGRELQDEIIRRTAHASF